MTRGCWVKMDVHLDDDPRIVKAGYHAASVFLCLVRQQAKRGWDGAIPALFLDPAWVAAILRCAEEHAAEGLSRLFEVGLLRQTENGAYIPGWDLWRPETSAERTRKWRKRQSNSKQSKPAPKTQKQSRPLPFTADAMVEAFAQGAGANFVAPGKLTRAQAIRCVAVVRDLEARSYGLDDVRMAGEYVAGWRNGVPKSISWLLMDGKLVEVIELARAVNARWPGHMDESYRAEIAALERLARSDA